MDQEGARRAFQEYIVRRVSNKAWAQLVEESYAEEWSRIVAEGEFGERKLLEQMSARLQEIEAHEASARRPKSTKPSSPRVDRRAEIISDICAGDARTRAEVIQFRRDVLSGQLITIEVMPEWIRTRIAKKRVPQARICIELPPGHQLLEEKAGDRIQWRIDPPLTIDIAMVAERRGDTYFAVQGPMYKWGSERAVLTWADLDHEWVSATPVVQGSELDRLRIVSEQLAADYGWSPHASVAFVLTDVVPEIRFLTASENRKGFLGRGRGLFRRRIKIEAEAWVNSDDVVSAFNAAKRGMGKAGKWPLRGKQARLLEFVDGLEEGLTWWEKMARWNREAAHPTETYHDDHNFRRDFIRVRDRVGTVLQGGEGPDSDING